MENKEQSVYEKYKEAVEHCHGLPLPESSKGEHFCESFGCWDIVELLGEIEKLQKELKSKA